MRKLICRIFGHQFHAINGVTWQCDRCGFSLCEPSLISADALAILKENLTFVTTYRDATKNFPA